MAKYTKEIVEGLLLMLEEITDTYKWDGYAANDDQFDWDTFIKELLPFKSALINTTKYIGSDYYE